MQRRIEDIKINKNKKQITFKEEVVIAPKPVKKIKEEKKVFENRIEDNRDEEIIKEKESQIDEYLQNRLNKEQRIPSTPRLKKKKRVMGRATIVLLFIAVLGGLVYWGGNIFQKANITITSKHEPITYNKKQFTALKNSTEGNIEFEIMIVSDKKNKNIVLTEAKEVSEKAKGSVTLYNEFSTTAQALVAGTFLSDEDGKSYKLDSKVTIPGYKLDANKKIIPGKIVANVSSFLPGDAYNGSPDSFHVNSFKGTSKYNKIYGKLESPFNGGASGLVYVLGDSDKSNMDNIAKNSFKNDLLNKVKALVPEGYILYPNAMTFSYQAGESVYSKMAETTIEVSGSLSVVLLKEDSLTKNIIKTSLPKISGDELKEIKISGLNNLVFNFTNTEQQITKEVESIPFTLTGDIDAIWYPDIELLKTELLNIHKDKVLPIFRQDPGISSALVNIFPPWQKYIPNNLDKINIILK